MISIDILCHTVPGVQRAEVERWIGNAWLRAEGPQGEWRFAEIDVARVRLICELRNDLGIDEDALPVVLSLVDQLYATRRQMEKLRRAVEEAAPEEVRQAILGFLRRPPA